MRATFHILVSLVTLMFFGGQLFPAVSAQQRDEFRFKTAINHHGWELPGVKRSRLASRKQLPSSENTAKGRLRIPTPSITNAPQSGTQHASLTRAQIREAERRLSDMGYWTGAVDGRFDPATRSALIAFQKWEGRPITGRLTLGELEAIRTSASPGARELGYEHVEVDLDRQVLLLVNDAGGVRVLPVSTGSGKPFIDEGQTSIAYTPRGRFIVYDKIIGWDHGPIGSLYYPNYISGGVAIHGSGNVPIQPETHGCIRIPIFAAIEMSKRMPVGTIVLVYDKISFVSAKSWAANPKLKQAAALNSAN